SIVITNVIICCFSWYFHKKDKHNLALGLIILCGVIIRIFVSADGFLHEWDEQFHALVAKHLTYHHLIPTLYENPVLPYDFTNWSENHVWLHKQPLALWGMALGLKLFGLNEWAIRIPTIIISCLGIWLTYNICKNLFDKKTAWFAAFLHAIHGYIVELTGGRVATDHTDIYFLVFIALGIFLSILSSQNANKRWLDILTGIATGLAVLAKWLPALIVLPVFALLHFDKKSSIVRITTGLITVIAFCFLVSAPWQFYIDEAFPKEAAWEKHYNWVHITEAVETHSAQWYYHLRNLPMLFGELIYLPLIVFLYFTIKKRQTKYIAIALWVFTPLIFFSIVATKMKAYILFTAPAIFIITALAIRFLLIHKRKFKYKWVPNLVILLLLALPIRYSIERIKPFSKAPRNPEWSIELKSLAKKITAKNAVVFNIDHPIKAMFYGNFTAYKRIPEIEKIQELIKKGYQIYLYKITPSTKQKYDGVSGINFID
ncbi:MAG: 4-amino-4-deoxy-L-arabinose transferase-like glycosyltransferase, partial [Patescibacteria group bacterium]